MNEDPNLPEFHTESTSDRNAVSEFMDTQLNEAGEVTEPIETPAAPEVPDAPPPPAENNIPEAQVQLESKEKPAVSDEDLDKQLDSIKPKNPNQEKGFSTLKNLVKEERAARKAAEKKAQELEETNKGIEPLTSEIKQQLEEYKAFQLSQAPDSDPEFQAKYTGQLKEKNDQALAIMKSHGLKDHIAEMIAQKGGISAIANSTETVPSALGGDQTWSEWLAETILPRLPFADSKRVEKIISETLDLTDNMAKEIEYNKTHATEVIQKKAKAIGESYSKGATETIKSLGAMAIKWEYPKDATPEQRAEVDKHNVRYEKVFNAFKEYEAGIKDPETLGRMVVTAAQSVYLADANKELLDIVTQLRSDLADRESKILKMKGSSQLAKKSNAPQPNSTPKPDPNKRMDAKQAVDAFLKD